MWQTSCPKNSVQIDVHFAEGRFELRSGSQCPTESECPPDDSIVRQLSCLNQHESADDDGIDDDDDYDDDDDDDDDDSIVRQLSCLNQHESARRALRSQTWNLSKLFVANSSFNQINPTIFISYVRLF